MHPRNVLAVLALFLSSVVLFAQAPSPDLSSFIRTPPAPATPRINGATVFGARPGRPFFFHLPVSGDRPMTIAAEGLPAGLTLNASTGNITGTVTTPGSYKVGFTATNTRGHDSRKRTFVIGPTICLTPPMGWNSWNCFAGNIDQAKIRGAADAMISTHLIDHGWAYINMDDRWQGDRDASGKIQPSAAIGDMKAMTDYIHGLGLKAGLYSSPGPFTCAGAVGSYGHEDQDAQSYADWGFDYLKYDWCSYDQKASAWRAGMFEKALPADAGAIRETLQQIEDNQRGHDQIQGNDAAAAAKRKPFDDARERLMAQLEGLYAKVGQKQKEAIDLEANQAPYRVMRAALDKVNRDIVFSFCQYGMGHVERWGAELGGNLWRVTGDISPSWESLEAHAFQILPADGAQFANPGHWNDPDMLEVGNGSLTPDENYLHMTAWCMLAAPLLIGCDMPHMSPFIVSLFDNDEVIAVDQDPLGRQGGRVEQEGTTEVWAKPLANGSLAVAFFNRGPAAADVTAHWPKLKLAGTQSVRDLWRQKNLDPARGAYTVHVASHGAELFKLTPLFK